jgi:DNA-binding NarL/FixJ family response regulator
MPDNPTTSVLLIDANDTDRIRFAAYLKDCASGYTIFEAKDGQSGLGLYRSHGIHRIVLALDLPESSGFRVLSELEPIASRPRVVVIALTDRTMRGIHEMAMKNGAYTCFVSSSHQATI